jgi:hypothetical protein
MSTIKTLCLAVLICLIAVGTASHSLSPGFEKKFTVSDTYTMTYELSNQYPFPAVFEVKVFNKDFSENSDWTTEKIEYKLEPTSVKNLNITFHNVRGTQRRIVCTILKGIGYEESPPQVTTRVCSRIIITGPS